MTKITDLLDIQQAAKFLNVSETSLRRWTNDGRLTCLRLGKKKVRRFRHEDLLAFMLEQKAELSPSRDQNGGRGLQAQGALSLQAHLCSLYRNDDGETRLANDFIDAGLEEGCVCFLIVPPDSRAGGSE